MQFLSAEHAQALAGVKVGAFILFEEAGEVAYEEWGDGENDGSGNAETASAEDESTEPDVAIGSAPGSDFGDEEVSADVEVSDQWPGNEESFDVEASNPWPGNEGGFDVEASVQWPENDNEPLIATSEAADSTGYAASPTNCLFRIVELVHDSTGAIEDLLLERCKFSTDPTTTSVHSRFTIYGEEIVHLPPIIAAAAEEERFEDVDGEADSAEQPHAPITLQSLARSCDLKCCTLQLSPTAISLLPLLGYNRGSGTGNCWTNCNDGCLHCLTCLVNILPTTIYATAATQPHRPVCPACMGLDLLKDQQNLPVQLENFLTVDFGATVEFLGRFDARATQELGYDFWQYYEREWGYIFDDMLEDDQEAQDGGNDGNDGYENFPEALDPAANVVTHPADKETIAALPRMEHAETREAIDLGKECFICRDRLEDETVVVTLTCGDVVHECVTHWLEQFDTCPTCRAVVGQGGVGTADEGEGEATAGEATAGDGLGVIESEESSGVDGSSWQGRT